MMSLPTEASGPQIKCAHMLQWAIKGYACSNNALDFRADGREFMHFAGLDVWRGWWIKLLSVR